MSEVFDVHQQWFDPVIGGFMIGGKIYYGLPNTDPTILSNQIGVFADRSLTVALPNPQTIGMGGRVENKPWVGQRYSIQVDDKNDVTRYSSPDQGENASTGAALSLSNVQGINAITGLTPAGISQYDDQQIFTLRTVATNTGDVTINIDGVGVKPLKFNFNEQIAPRFLQADQVISFIYNSVGDKFIWINSGRGISLLTGVAGDGDTITANGGPSTIAYVDGQLYQFKPNADNTGAVTLEINSLGAIAVQNKGIAMSAGQLTIDTLYIVAYNSTGNIFELVSGVELPDATETIKGKAELATQAEVDVGTDDTRIVTPLKLINWSKRGVIQHLFESNFASGSTSVAMPASGTPTNSQGAEFMSLSITPLFADSIIIVKYSMSGQVQQPTTPLGWTTALFKDSIVNAIAAAAVQMGFVSATLSVHQNTVGCGYKEVAGDLSSRTFKVRGGPNSGSADVLNFNAGFTVPASFMEILEIRF